MTKPISKLYPGGVIKFIAVGDEYNNPESKKVERYEKSKVMIIQAGNPKSFELTKSAFEALQDFFGEAEIQKQMKDWM